MISFKENLIKKHQLYQDQEALNRKCNTFVKNFQKAYVGDNTAAQQIGSSVPENIGSKHHTDCD